MDTHGTTNENKQDDTPPKFAKWSDLKTDSGQKKTHEAIHSLIYDSSEAIPAGFKGMFPNLTRLTFGPAFNQPIQKGTLPPTLRSITFGDSFNKKLVHACLPLTLMHLIFGDAFNQKIEAGVLRINIHVLRFGKSYNQQLVPSAGTFGTDEFEPGTLPPFLSELEFGCNFNQKLEKGLFPDYLRSIVFGQSFNHALPENVLPVNLDTLVFGSEFNTSLDKVVFPMGLRTLVFGTMFNQEVKEKVLPKGLLSLSFGDRFNKPVVFPSTIQALVFGADFRPTESFVHELHFLKVLVLPAHAKRELDVSDLPSTLEYLYVGGLKLDLAPENMNVHHDDRKDVSYVKERKGPLAGVGITLGSHKGVSGVLNQFLGPGDIASMSRTTRNAARLARDDWTLNRFQTYAYTQALEMDPSEQKKIVNMLYDEPRIEEGWANKFPSLKHLEFQRKMNPDIENFFLPQGLESVCFPSTFEISPGVDDLPGGLKHLKFYGTSIDGKVLPTSLVSITLGVSFRSNILRTIDWTQYRELTSMHMGYYNGDFNKDKNMLPPNLTSLDMGYGPLAGELKPGVFEQGLKHLRLPTKYNLQLNKEVVPASLTSIEFGDRFNQIIQKNTLPVGVTDITFGDDFNQNLGANVLPEGLTHLVLGCGFGMRGFGIWKPTTSVELVLPSTLTHLTFSRWPDAAPMSQAIQKCIHLTHLRLCSTKTRRVQPRFVPNSVTHLEFTKASPDLGGDVCISLESKSLPTSLKHLTLRCDSISAPYADTHAKVCCLEFPNSLVSMSFGPRFRSDLLMENFIPKSVRTLYVYVRNSSFGENPVDHLASKAVKAFTESGGDIVECRNDKPLAEF